MSSRTLDRVRIATPCPVSWEQMRGDSRVRHCYHCQLSVYNISELGRREAEALLTSTEGRVCARLYRRSDGTLITKDCPVGLRALRRRISKTAAALFAIIGSLSSVAFGQGQSNRRTKDSCTAQAPVTQKEIAFSSQETIIAGTVLDPAGAVVQGAGVFLTNTVNKTSKETKSNADGRFQFAGIPAGRYSIEIFFPGFKGKKQKNVNVKPNQTVDMSITLKLDDTVLMGVIGFTPNDPPGTTTITEKVFRSLPH